MVHNGSRDSILMRLIYKPLAMQGFDVLRMTGGQCLTDAVTHAVHVRLSGPIAEYEA
jgi:hypothetical protein